MTLTPVGALSLCRDLLMSAGVSERDAVIVAQHLVEASLMGVTSHGVRRIVQYTDEIAAKELDPVAIPRSQGAGARVRIDGNRSLGPVAGQFAVTECLSALDSFGVAVVTTRRTGHVGRIGAYASRLAENRAFALACASGPPSGHWVAPFGGREGRLATNPIAWAAPTSGQPIVADFGTSAVTEGLVRLLFEGGQPVPDGALVDADGKPTTRAAALYETPRGAILPFGGMSHGHRGSALAIMVELLATSLAGDLVGDADRIGNNLTLIAFRVDETFEKRADELARHIRATAPREGVESVLLPGDREYTLRQANTGVELDDAAWRAIENRAAQRSVDLPESYVRRGTDPTR